MRSDAGRSGPSHVTMSGRVATVDDAKRYEDAGVTRLLVMLDPRDPDGFKRFGDEVIANA
jgi:hypothetical protein